MEKQNKEELLRSMQAKVIEITHVMLECAELDEIEEIDSLSRQRGQVLNIVSYLNSQVNSEMNEFTKEFMDLDEELENKLQQLKNEVKKEISVAFKNKSKFKGYNLKSTR